MEVDILIIEENLEMQHRLIYFWLIAFLRGAAGRVVLRPSRLYQQSLEGNRYSVTLFCVPY